MKVNIISRNLIEEIANMFGVSQTLVEVIFITGTITTAIYDEEKAIPHDDFIRTVANYYIDSYGPAAKLMFHKDGVNTEDDLCLLYTVLYTHGLMDKPIYYTNNNVKLDDLFTMNTNLKPVCDFDIPTQGSSQYMSITLNS